MECLSRLTTQCEQAELLAALKEKQAARKAEKAAERYNVFHEHRVPIFIAAFAILTSLTDSGARRRLYTSRFPNA